MKEAHIEFTIDSSPKQLVICADGQYIAALLDDGRIALVTVISGTFKKIYLCEYLGII
jgi:hypothetical protein